MLRSVVLLRRGDDVVAHERTDDDETVTVLPRAALPAWVSERDLSLSAWAKACLIQLFTSGLSAVTPGSLADRSATIHSPNCFSVSCPFPSLSYLGNSASTIWAICVPLAGCPASAAV